MSSIFQCSLFSIVRNLSDFECVLIRDHWNKNVIASNWTSNAAASCLSIDENDRRFQLWQWFDKVLAICLSNSYMI